MKNEFFSKKDIGGLNPILFEETLRKLNNKNRGEKPKLGIYAGSFNPMHVGHMNVLEKSEQIFGRGNVMLAIGCNPEKVKEEDREAFKQEQEARSEELSNKIGRAVIPYFLFLDEFIMQKEEEGYDVFLVRGLRNGEDLAHEDNQLKFIEDFLDFLEIEYVLKTIFLRCDRKYDHISSSAIKAIDTFGNKGLKRTERYKV
jgi:cytidyltransferase-like protein